MDNNNSNINNDKLNIEEYMSAFKKSAKRSGSAKLYSYDWLQDTKMPQTATDLVEVRFKNTRKEFFINSSKLTLEVGDMVAVEASPGHDIGVVSLLGELVRLQIQKVYKDKIPETFSKIYRKAKPSDVEKWREAKALEQKTMIKARQIAKDMNLNMKIGDVEYQGDKTKAIFYYIADERVDFRQLIKVFAEEFKIRVEMRQIGVRQEAGRIGGIGLCGRDLCCSSFVTNFVPVSTNAARYQEVSLNPQKMAGQCGKLKCCLNYELASYMDARKNLPDITIPLEFKEGKAFHAKTDVYRAMLTYQYRKDDITTFVELPASRVKEIIEMNKRGSKPEKLEVEPQNVELVQAPDYENVVGQESLTRFDKKKNNNNNPNRNKNNNNKPNRNNNPNNNNSNKNNNNKPQKQQAQAANQANQVSQKNQNPKQQNNNKQQHNNKQKWHNAPNKPQNGQKHE